MQCTSGHLATHMCACSSIYQLPPSSGPGHSVQVACTNLMNLTRAKLIRAKLLNGCIYSTRHSASDRAYVTSSDQVLMSVVCTHMRKRHGGVDSTYTTSAFLTQLIEPARSSSHMICMCISKYHIAGFVRPRLSWLVMWLLCIRSLISTSTHHTEVSLP